jgi:hypothetical protein
VWNRVVVSFTLSMLAVTSSALLGCNRPATNASVQPGSIVRDSSQGEILVLLLDVTHGVDIGYGRIWRANVREVRRGSLADAVISLHTFDESAYNGLLRCCEGERGLEITFRRVLERPAALVGFEASDGTIWSLREIRARDGS